VTLKCSHSLSKKSAATIFGERCVCDCVKETDRTVNGGGKEESGAYVCVCVLQGEGQNGTNVKKVCYEQTDRTE
jgi:hypothetical protein